MQIDPFEMLWNAFLPILSTFTGGLVTDLTTLMIAILIIICILIGFDLLFDALTGSERTLAGFREQQRLRRMRALDPAPTRRFDDSEIDPGSSLDGHSLDPAPSRDIRESEIFLSGAEHNKLEDAYKRSGWLE